MTLTGQVFPLMGHAAAPEQIPHIIAAVERNLLDGKIGYRLNSRFGGIQQNLGLGFGFAFGHKENGAMFSHMTVMYGNALYKQGYVDEGRKVLESLYPLVPILKPAACIPEFPNISTSRAGGCIRI
jgi:cellobiose phosphorylase